MNEQTPELTPSATAPFKSQFHVLWGMAQVYDYQKSEWKKMHDMIEALPLALSNTQINEELAKRVVLQEPINLTANTITVKEISVEADPPITVYNVEIVNSTGVWCETLGSREHLTWFLRGLRVATSMAGNTLLMSAVWKFGEDSIIDYWP